MHLCYNGIEMESLDIPEDGIQEEDIYDDTGVDYLYTRHQITGRFLVNGQTEVERFVPFTSYDINPAVIETTEAMWRRTAPSGVIAAGVAAAPTAGGVNNPSFGRFGAEGGPIPYVPNSGIYANSTRNQNIPFVSKVVVPSANTLTTIRRRLHQPRGKLFFYTGSGDPRRKDQMLLMSPEWGDHTDCKNGPTVLFCRVMPISGDARSFLVDFSVETFVRYDEVTLTTEYGAVPTPAGSPLLSNRYSMQHYIDSDSYLTISVHGTALFRTDKLYQAVATNPDQFRLSTIPPIPFGMTRESLSIEAIPDVTGFHYAFVDRQMHANFVAGPYAGCSQIEAIHRQAISIEENIGTSAMRAFEKSLNLRANMNWAAEKDAPPPKPGMNMAALASSGRSGGSPTP